jgi:hypothetical protein
MSDSTDRTSALAELTRLVQPAVEPVLTYLGASNELEAILDKHRLATTWVHNTAYTPGQTVLPTVRNGHRYRCRVGGTSTTLAADEPTWLKSQGVCLVDGTSDPQLIWEEYGPDYANIYDVRAAAHEAWMLKAQKASNNFDMKLGSLTFNRSQVFDHCLMMAQKFAPISFG